MVVHTDARILEGSRPRRVARRWPHLQDGVIAGLRAGVVRAGSVGLDRRSGDPHRRTDSADGGVIEGEFWYPLTDLQIPPSGTRSPASLTRSEATPAQSALRGTKARPRDHRDLGRRLLLDARELLPLIELMVILTAILIAVGGIWAG